MLIAWICLPVALAAFMLPGWQLARRLGADTPALTAFFISGALWCNLVLGLNALSVSLERTHLLAAWAAVCLLASVWAWRKPLPPSDNVTTVSSKPSGWEWLWLLPPAFAIISIGVRGVLDPINGWDNSFRWDGLARAIWYHRTIDFYPPVSAAHFEIYAWCDGIPPLVALLNLWIYLFTDNTDAALLVGRVLGESTLIGMAIFVLAKTLWGHTGGWPALAVAAASSLLLWGVSISQETGLTALSLVSLVYFCIRHHGQPSFSMAASAGLAAGIGALSREYGLAFIVLGGAVFMLSPQGRRDLPAYGGAAALTACPWYIRNWMLTGNPVFANELGGLFPTNPVYSETMQTIASHWSLGTGLHSLGTLALTIFIVGGLCLPCAAVGVFRLKSRAGLPAAAIVVITGLWLWSLPLTAGGWNYSLRVLTPAIAIGASLCGWMGSFRRIRWIMFGLVLMLSMDAARRSWLLPIAPRVAPLPYSFHGWREWQDFAGHITRHPVWAFLAARTKEQVVLVDTPPAHTLVTSQGGRVAMLFSPAAAPCFDASLTFQEARVRLLKNDVRWIALTIDDPVAQTTIRKHPFMRTLVENTTPYARAESIAIYDLASPKSPQTPSP